MITFLSFTLGFVCGFVAGFFFTRSKKKLIDKTIVDIRLAQEVIKREFHDLQEQVTALLDAVKPSEPTNNDNNDEQRNN